MKIQCPYCGTGCGIEVEKNRIKPIKDALCKRGMDFLKPLSKDRLITPLYRPNKSEDFISISWETAFRILKQKLSGLTPEEIYFYISAQILTEEMYLFNKLAKGFLKTNNIDANSRLCVATPPVVYQKAFGSPATPCSYECLENASLIVIVGHNPASNHPVLFRKIANLKRKKGVKVIVIDPYKSETTKIADMHIQLNPATDVVFFNAVARNILIRNLEDREFIERYTENFEEFAKDILSLSREEYHLKNASKICGVKEEEIEKFATEWVKAKSVVSTFAMGINQSVIATQKGLSLINLHLLTGKLGKGRGCPFSITGQPNAMGGREVGYFTGKLPSFRSLYNERDRKEVEAVWNTSLDETAKMKELTIVEAIDEILRGKIKFLWVVGTNPAVSLPNLEKVHKALEEVFLVVSEAYLTDTAKFANLILPAKLVGEKEGTMTNSERVVSACEVVVSPPPNTKSEFEVLIELAQRLGFGKEFSYSSPTEVFEEIKLLTKGRECEYRGRNFERYGDAFLYSDMKFPTESSKAKFNKVSLYIPPKPVKREEFVLITLHLIKVWNTLSKTEKVQEIPPPVALMNEEDAKMLGIKEGEEIEITNPNLNTKIRRKVKFADIKRGCIGVYFNHGYKYTETPANLVVEDKIDPYSKQPDYKFNLVEIKRLKKKNEFLGKLLVPLARKQL